MKNELEGAEQIEIKGVKTYTKSIGSNDSSHISYSLRIIDERLHNHVEIDETFSKFLQSFPNAKKKETIDRIINSISRALTHVAKLIEPVSDEPNYPHC